MIRFLIPEIFLSKKRFVKLVDLFIGMGDVCAFRGGTYAGNFCFFIKIELMPLLGPYSILLINRQV